MQHGERKKKPFKESSLLRFKAGALTQSSEAAGTPDFQRRKTTCSNFGFLGYCSKLTSINHFATKRFKLAGARFEYLVNHRTRLSFKRRA